MAHSSPVDWIETHAETDGGRPALAFAEGFVTFRQLLDEIARRRASLVGECTAGEVVPVAMRQDLPSIVELLALQSLGACPYPYLDRVPGLPVDRAQDAVLAVATSGTTSLPRVVPLTMGNVEASVVASRDRLGTSSADRWLIPLPLHHVGGVMALFRVFESGAAAIVHRFGPDLPDLVERASPTVASMVPTMVRRLLDQAPDALASIGAILIGGGPLHDSLLRESLDAGATILPTYGMTETASQVATVAPGEPAVGVGKPLSGFLVRIVDGIIEVDGDAVFGGYLGSVPRSGPYRTSDRGEFDGDGNLLVLGRADDVVVTGGENVSLSKVEAVLAALDAVSGVAVVPVPDPEWGTAICAMVVADDLARVREQARWTLARHEVPKRWLAVDSIPLLSTGKHDVRQVKAAFGDG